MKRTFAGIENMVGLVEQWTSSIKIARACMLLLDEYQIRDIQIGIITENNDFECREKGLRNLLHPDVSKKRIPSSADSKHKASKAGDIAKAKLLKGFDEGKVTICGYTYTFDIREFIDKKHDMWFENGILVK